MGYPGSPGTLAFLWLTAAAAPAAVAAAGVPDTGLYVSPQFTPGQLTIYTERVYSRRPNLARLQYTSGRTRDEEVGSAELAIELDVAVPPNATAEHPQPTVVWIHGGGYQAGNKEDAHDKVLSYAQAGYVAVTINYRLTPENDQNPQLRMLAILQAGEDAMNAIRYLKQNAALFHIDPTRMATIGTSAGGGLSLINAVEYDTLISTLSDHPGVSSRVEAAITTGATLTEEGIDTSRIFSFDAQDTPVLLFHANPTDSVTGATWEDVLATQNAINGSGNSCTVVAQPNMSHTVDLSLGGRYWPDLKPFLWERLRLGELVQGSSN